MNDSMTDTAIKNAKFHGIDLHRGIPTPGDGDCAFVATANNISMRECFE